MLLTCAAGSLILTLLAGDPCWSQQKIDPQHVVGREKCSQCHAREMDAWNASKHATLSWKLLDEPAAADFAEAIGVSNPKAAGSACVSCHGTQTATVVVPGNSCESCHGAAGGEGGWFDLHSDFGQGGTEMADLLKQRTTESAEHRATRIEACQAAGMNQAEDVLSLARNCLQCHTVPNEELIGAKHPSSEKFEFVEWSQGEVRHNFLLDASKNAEVPTAWISAGEGRSVEGRKALAFIAGQLADLEVSLRNRAGATSVKRNTLGDLANDRITDAIKELSRMDDEEIDTILALVADVDKDSLGETTPEDKATYVKHADNIKAAAEAYVKKHADGSGLPEVKIPRKAQGDPHTP